MHRFWKVTKDPKTGTLPMWPRLEERAFKLLGCVSLYNAFQDRKRGSEYTAIPCMPPTLMKKEAKGLQSFNLTHAHIYQKETEFDARVIELASSTYLNSTSL